MEDKKIIEEVMNNIFDILDIRDTEISEEE